MPADLTAILLPLPPRGMSPDQVVNVVAQNAPPAAWIRLAPLEKVDIHQLEVLEGASGLPSISPAEFPLSFATYSVPASSRVMLWRMAA